MTPRPKNVLPYKPHPSVTRGKCFTTNPSTIAASVNNQVTNLDYLESLDKYEEMVNYIFHSPIDFALTLDAEEIYCDYLREFWYTTDLDDAEEKIMFSLMNGSKKLEINLNEFRQIIQLNYLNDENQYAKLPNASLAIKFLTKVKYVFASVNTTNKNIIQKKNFNAKWWLLCTYIIQCLFGASRSNDQLNTIQLRVIYAITKGINIDFGRIIFEDLIAKIQKKGGIHVPYIRFLSLVFKDLLKESYQNVNLASFPIPILGSNIFTNNVSEKEVSLSVHMVTALRPGIRERVFPKPAKKTTSEDPLEAVKSSEKVHSDKLMILIAEPT